MTTILTQSPHVLVVADNNVGAGGARLIEVAGLLAVVVATRPAETRVGGGESGRRDQKSGKELHVDDWFRV